MPTRADCCASATFVSCFASRLEESSRAYMPSEIERRTVIATSASTRVNPFSPRGDCGLVGARIAEPHVHGLGRLTQPRKRAARRADDNGQKLDPVGSGRQDAVCAV